MNQDEEFWLRGEGYDIKQHELAGLTYVGKNAEGQNEYVGTTEQWNKFEELTKQYANHS